MFLIAFRAMLFVHVFPCIAFRALLSVLWVNSYTLHSNVTVSFYYQCSNHLKIILFAFKGLNGLAPLYISELLHPYRPTRSLRSADKLLLSVPKTKCKLKGIVILRQQLLNCGTMYLYTLDRHFHCLFLSLFLKTTSMLWPLKTKIENSCLVI